MSTDILDQYNYEFPLELVAQAPASPRDSARLLVYDRRTKKISHDIFRNLAEYLPKNAVLVFNQTKVIPARFTVHKPSGGKVTLLYLGHDNSEIKALSDRALTIGTRLAINSKLKLVVKNRADKGYVLVPNFGPGKILNVLRQYGRMPLPPYIKHSPLSTKQIAQQYQTVFAKNIGSVAAPTASLHFTNRLIKDLKSAGISTAFITLHVGLGTFAPVTPDQIKQKKLHTEFYEIDPATAVKLNEAKQKKRPIIGVGTTAVRALESASSNSGKLTRLHAGTELFIQENDKLKFADGLITNFHVPRSSLLMLVSAFTGRKQLMSAYREAIAHEYKLFSFGDAMLIV